MQVAADKLDETSRWRWVSPELTISMIHSAAASISCKRLRIDHCCERFREASCPAHYVPLIVRFCIVRFGTGAEADEPIT